MTCNDSPTIYEGEIWVQHYANIECVAVYNTDQGKIAITPRNGSRSVHTVYDNDSIVKQWIDGDYTVWVKIKTIFYGSTGTKVMQFYLCWEPTYTPPVTCTQTFKMQDQNGNPLNGNVQIGTTAITVLGTGTITLEQGKSYSCVASFSDMPVQSRTFTACTTETFIFIVPEIGTLNCYSTPTGAEIFINGASVGFTDKEGIELNPGVYDVVLKKSGYGDVYKEVTIVLGITGIIRVDLIEVCPIPTLTGITRS